MAAEWTFQWRVNLHAMSKADQWHLTGRQCFSRLFVCHGAGTFGLFWDSRRKGLRSVQITRDHTRSRRRLRALCLGTGEARLKTGGQEIFLVPLTSHQHVSLAHKLLSFSYCLFGHFLIAGVLPSRHRWAQVRSDTRLVFVEPNSVVFCLITCITPPILRPIAHTAQAAKNTIRSFDSTKSRSYTANDLSLITQSPFLKPSPHFEETGRAFTKWRIAVTQP